MFEKKGTLKYNLKDKHGHVYGCVMAFPPIEKGGEPLFGFSICRKGDRYDKTTGENICYNRAVNLGGYSGVMKYLKKYYTSFDKLHNIYQQYSQTVLDIQTSSRMKQMILTLFKMRDRAKTYYKNN